MLLPAVLGSTLVVVASLAWCLLLEEVVPCLVRPLVHTQVELCSGPWGPFLEVASPAPLVVQYLGSRLVEAAP